MIARWVRFWDEREAPEALALVRILVALVILLDLGGVFALGLVPALWAAPPNGLGWMALLDAAPPTAVRLFGASASTIWLLYGACVFAAFALGVGWWHRPAAFVLAWSSAALAALAPEGDRGIDQLLRVAVLVLGFSRADARYSVAAWWRRRTGHGEMELIPAWPRRLLFAQLVWVYFSAAHNRAGVAWWPWGEFSAIANILGDPHYARFTPGWIAPLYPASQLLTALTMVFELGAPALFWLSWADAAPGRGGAAGAWVRRLRLRYAYLALGAALHLGIALTLRLGIFSYGMLALYPVFLRPAEISALGRAFRCVLRLR